MTTFLAWHNLLFYLPLLLGIILVLGAAMGVADFAGDIDVDMDIDADADMDLDADADADGDADSDGGIGAVRGLLMLLGVGRVPLSILMMVALLVFGGVGISAKMMLLPSTGVLAATGVAAAIAFVSMLVLSGVSARGIAKLVPSTETYARSGDALIGSVARAHLRIDTGFGLAQVTDDTGTLFEIRCRSYGARIAKGSEVLITEYDAESDVFTVESCEEL
jgi:membrane protein implicated in regulation of membrane protease activity